MPVRLVPIPADRLPEWISRSTREYASDLVALGKDPSHSLVEASRGMDESFPGGTPLPLHHVLDVVAEPDGIVGYVWIGPSQGGDAHEWWLWDILIEAEHRGKGLGKEAMLAAEDFASRQGAKTVGLSVFGFNESAKRLYSSLGYEVTTVKMAKSLPTPPDV